MKKRAWGTDPYFFGPRQYFRQTLLISYIKKGNNLVLDAGCGNGSLSFRIAKRGNKVIGVDIKKENIDFCNNVKQSLRIKNLNFMQMSLTDITFKDKLFDVVISGEVLEHIKDDNKVVKQFNRVLKKGGQCVISVPQNPDLWSVEDDWVGHIRRYEKEELINLLEKNGFRINKINSIGFPLVRAYFYFFNKLVLKKKINKSKKTKENKFIHKIINIFSYIFFFDTLFSWFNKGNWLILSATKIKDVK